MGRGTRGKRRRDAGGGRPRLHLCRRWSGRPGGDETWRLVRCFLAKPPRAPRSFFRSLRL